MKNITSKIVFILTVIALIISLTACGSRTEPNSVEIKNDIIFVNTYENYAYGWVYNGCYIDKDGYRHDFDFSGNSEIDKEDVDSMDKVLDLLENGYDFGGGKSVKALSKNKVQNCYGNLMEIQNFKFDEGYSHGCDMGESTLYGVVTNENGERVIIPIIQSGDWDCRNTDKNAVNVCNILGIDVERGIYHGLFQMG